jgi:hypothetical protein
MPFSMLFFQSYVFSLSSFRPSNFHSSFKG